MTPKSIGSAIKKARKIAGIKQISLASQIQMTVAQVKFLESGRKNIDSNTLQAIESIVGPLHVYHNPTSLKAV